MKTFNNLPDDYGAFLVLRLIPETPIVCLISKSDDGSAWKYELRFLSQNYPQGLLISSSDDVRDLQTVEGDWSILKMP